MESKFSSSISQIPPSLILNDGFELSDQSLIPSKDIIGSFSPDINKVELFIYDVNNSLLDVLYDYNNWTITKNSDTSGLNNTDTIQIDPSNDLIERGYDAGNLYAVYNFINYELSTSPTNLLFISEISPDRTEIKLNSNFISNTDLETTFNDLKSKIDSADFFDEFYISSLNNNYNIAVNLLLDTSTPQYSILIKLYNALPTSISLKDEIYVATKVAETQAYEVKFFNNIPSRIDNIQYLKGPNHNLDIKNFVNNSSPLKSKSELLNASTTGSNNNLQNILNQKGVKITPNYSFNTFDEFINFSSAKKRIENFYEKISQIQSYEDDINIIKSSITGPTSSSIQVSSSLASANSNIETIIKNFDGYEYSLFYNSGSSAYPKTPNSSFPHPLQNTGSTEVLQWMGSDIEGSSNYGGIILSASLYDSDNQNWLYYTIPEFIRENQDNNNYIDFANMVGQHFDEIWLYTKSVSEKTNTTNELDKGIPLKIAEDAIKSLGYEGFGNNFSNQNNYIGLIGEEDGSYVPPIGDEIIDNYIAINNGTIVNYWNPSYSFIHYVQQLGEKGFPYPIDKVSKEIYKRLYHNMAYLVKKKGSVSGLRQLINIWGIPDTILRINEFGGKNKDNTDDYDYWYNRYNYEFSPISTQNVASASAIIPWMPLERNRIENNEYIVPDNLQFRFKTTGYPSSSYAGEFFSQSLAVKKSDGDETSTNFDFGIGLFYTGSATGSYSGSSNNTYKDWGVVRFYISGSPSEGGTVVSDDIYLPVYDRGWWSVMLQRDAHPSASVHTTDTNYTLYVKNKIYNGTDRNQIAFEGSASISINGSTSSSINQSWNIFGTGSHDGIYLGGLVSGSNVGTHTLNNPSKMFSGSFQEFRYYSNNIPETVFNDFVMNPESIEGNNITGSESSFDIVNFRAPLGNELEDKFTTLISSSHTISYPSFHPAVSAKSSLLITGSFVNPAGNITSSNYHIQYYENQTTRTFSKPNTEVYFLDQPSVGARNRISNKIQNSNNDNYGNLLSNQISIGQDYEVSRSYTEDNTNLEVAFSPQDNLNDDIIQAFGYGIIGDALADPRFISSSTDHYPDLRKSSEYFFQKYTEGNIYDYVRLIKYIDNSLFKAIKAYVPARTSVSTGIVIKQHMLERNRFTPPDITTKTTLAKSPESVLNTPLIFENLELTSSIDVVKVKGGVGGVVDKFNYTGSPNFTQTSITQSYNNTFDTIAGSQTIIEDTQREFYDGEYSGSKAIATTQDRFKNPFKGTPDDLSSISFNASSITLDTTYRNVITSMPNITSQGIFEVIGGNQLKIKSNTPQDLKLTFRSTSFFSGYSTFSNTSGFAIRIQISSNTRGQILNETLLKRSPGTMGCFVDTSIFKVEPHEIISIFYSSTSPVSDVKETTIDIRTINKWKGKNSSLSLPYGSFSCSIPNNINFTHGAITNCFPLYNISNNANIYPPTGAGNTTTGTNLYGSYFNGGGFTIIKSQTQDITYLILNEGPDTSVEGANVSFDISIFDITDFSNNQITNQEYSIRIISLERGTLGEEVIFPKTFPLHHTTQKYFIGNNESISIGIKPNSGYNSNSKQYYGVGIDINSFEAYSPKWDNSDFNALNNNFNLNRPNTFLQDVDYSKNASIPTNLNLIKVKVAEKAQTPDSNYTMRRVTLPRYEGSKLQSVNYNHSTLPSSNVTFLNGDTGSWSGDKSFGSTAVIDKNPIFMAHFKSSNESKELLDSYLFKVDALIELPFEDITGKTSTTEIPPIIKLDGSNKNLYEVSNTFEPGRDAIISYDTLKVGSIDLSTLPVGANKIYQGGVEYQLLNGSSKGSISVDHISSQTYITASIFNDGVQELVTSIPTTTNTFPLGSITNAAPSKSNSHDLGYYMYNVTDNTNNPVNDFKDAGRITLGGGPISFEQGARYTGIAPLQQDTLTVKGASLAIINTLNTRIPFPYTSSNGIKSKAGISAVYTTANVEQVGFSGGTIGRTWMDCSGSIGIGNWNISGSVPPAYVSDPSKLNDPNNFFYFNISESFDGSYEEYKDRFQIKPGDELSVIYSSTSTDPSGAVIVTNNKEESFTILKVTQSLDPAIRANLYVPGGTWIYNNSFVGDSNIENPPSPPINNGPTNPKKFTFDEGSVFDQLIVSPTPSFTMKDIQNFTIRRRVQADDRVIIFQFPPQNSDGANTPTGEGFIIPNDCTPQQKDNALTLISQLKGTNTFKE